MEHYLINDSESAKDFVEYVKSMPTIIPKVTDNLVEFNGDQFEVQDRYKYILRRFNNGNTNVRDNIRTNVDNNSISNCNNEIDDLIFGKDKTQHIISAELVGDEIWYFKNDGSIEKKPNEYWFLSSRPIGGECEELEGGLFFRYKRTFTDKELYDKVRGIMWKKKTPMFTVYDPVESHMTMNGTTFFKGLKVNDVSVLSFDIETTGVVHDKNSMVLMISNTFRINGEITRKLFALDDYKNDKEMIQDWCKYVQEIDPSFMIGHNIFGFDLPYLKFRGGELPLGKDCSEMKVANRPKKVRKDGSQSYDVYECKIFGRQIIDTWILAIKADVARKYESYGLKQIIKQEGLEKTDRTLFDFSEIFPKEIWKKFQDGDLEMWAAFKKYCIEDSDDSLKLFDLMIPQFFYYCQSLPMPFQTMNLTATGRQINGFLCRSYLQTGHSIPKPDEKIEYGGGISFGNPGIYSNVYKVDVASLYPSIMITEEIYNRKKDPRGNFLTMVKHFTKERLENKKKAKETGDRYFKDVEQGQKIVINSAYGLLGTQGVHFNSMVDADKTTRTGREILTKGIKWAEDQEFEIVNVDTDSFSYSPGKKLITITEKQAKSRSCEPRDEFNEQIVDLNNLFDDGIIWEDDGVFKKFIVVKAKNYILDDGKTIKIKGSGLKGSNREKALTEFVNNVIMHLLKGRKDHIFHEYLAVANEIKTGFEDIEQWVLKKTVTKSVLNPERTQEQKVFDAIQNIDYSEGDKVYLFCKDKDTLVLKKDFDGEYDKDTYYNKLYNCIKIFETLLDEKLFPNFKVGRNRNLV